jgi:protein-L-isoaspartate(D-aspartate) O-methyltransferase
MTRLLCFPILAVLANGQDWEAWRAGMVRTQIEARGIRHKGVLKSMRETPRHLFVPPRLREAAYEDHPLPIGYDQTISQPYIVALMSELLDPRPADRVLEIGTGSGYQAAVLSPLVAEVCTIEIVPELATSAKGALGIFGNVLTRLGDGYAGWPEKAPFDKIILTAAPPAVPQALFDQLKPGGRLVAPVGATPADQVLAIFDKDKRGRIRRTEHIAVRFVPMVPAKR